MATQLDLTWDNGPVLLIRDPDTGCNHRHPMTPTEAAALLKYLAASINTIIRTSEDNA